MCCNIGNVPGSRVIHRRLRYGIYFGIPALSLTITHILGDPLLQSVTTAKSKNNDFLTHCSLLLFVKNHKDLSAIGEGGKER
jgi:hypothetical protein